MQCNRICVTCNCQGRDFLTERFYGNDVPWSRSSGLVLGKCSDVILPGVDQALRIVRRFLKTDGNGRNLAARPPRRNPDMAYGLVIVHLPDGARLDAEYLSVNRMGSAAFMPKAGATVRAIMALHFPATVRWP